MFVHRKPGSIKVYPEQIEYKVDYFEKKREMVLRSQQCYVRVCSKLEKEIIQF